MITVISSNVPLNSDSDFLTLDVSPDLTVDDLRALIESETGAPAQSQILMRDGQPLQETTRTLRDIGINHDDLLGLQVEQAQPQQPRRSAGRSSGGPSPETIRQRMQTDPAFREQVRQQDPELAAAVSDSNRFGTLWADRERQMREAQMRAEQDISRLESDPSNPEFQAEIQRRIKSQVIAKNIEQAMEENPESFARVSMLYIDVTVNNVPIKAFVDSGAQTTIMSPSAAESCNITHLIDERYGGIARGVGTAKILGRVHHAIMQIGGYQAASSFTVMEGKDVDLLLGLDMLKRHQMSIDLRENCLRVQDAKIEFLPEHQIPKMMEDVLENEPKVAGPGGSTIGATTGTVEPGPQAGGSGGSQAQTSISSVPSGQTATTTQPPAAAPASAPAPATQAPPQAQAGSQITEEKINAVMQFGGVGRNEAIALLEQAGGNPDLALGLLF